MARISGKTGVYITLLTTCSVLLLSGCGAADVEVSLRLDGGTFYIESAGNINACVDLNQPPSASVTVFVTIAYQSAEPQDIEIEGMVVNNLMFTSSGNLTKCINIFIIDDEIAEEFEMFAISLSTLSSDVIITTSAMSILIMDNDAQVLGFENSSYTTDESDLVEVCVVMLGQPAERRVLFRLVTSSGSGTATPGSDFIQITESFSFEVGEQKKCGTVTILEDTVIENAESFQVTIDTFDVANGSAEVIITDNDGATVVLESPSETVTEADSGATSFVSVCVQLSSVQDGLDRDVVLSLTSTDNGTASGIVDYLPLVDKLLVIPSGSGLDSTPVCETVEIIGDDIREDNETFTITFGVVNALDMLVEDSTVTVTIQDNGDVIAECLPLDNPINGYVNMSGTIQGSVANYSCTVGYILDGPSQRQCGSDGEWNDSAPECEPVDCGLPSALDNGEIVADSTIFGSVLTYLCFEGYTINGSETRICQSNGLWSGSKPECVGCGPLADPMNGTVVLNTTQAIYTCDDGFGIVGNSTRVCQENGEWTDTDPSCQVATGNQPSKNNDDDTDEGKIIGIAVGASVGVLALITLVIIVVIVGWRMHRRSTFNKYATEYRKHVLPYSVYANQRRSREGEGNATNEDVHQWEMEQAPSADMLTADLPDQVEGGHITEGATKEGFHKENLI